MLAQTENRHHQPRGTKEPRDHRNDNTMIRVMTSKGYDFVKSSMLKHFINSGYVLALA